MPHDSTEWKRCRTARGRNKTSERQKYVTANSSSRRRAAAQKEIEMRLVLASLRYLPFPYSLPHPTPILFLAPRGRDSLSVQPSVFPLRARFPSNVIFRASDRPDFALVSCFALRRVPRVLRSLLASWLSGWRSGISCSRDILRLFHPRTFIVPRDECRGGERRRNRKKGRVCASFT